MLAPLSFAMARTSESAVSFIRLLLIYKMQIKSGIVWIVVMKERRPLYPPLCIYSYIIIRKCRNTCTRTTHPHTTVPTLPIYEDLPTQPRGTEAHTHTCARHIMSYSVFFLVLRTNHTQTHNLVMNDEIRPDRRGTWVDERGTTVHARLHATLHGVSVRHFDTLVHSLLKPRRP
jgi:hypothetical protein